MAPKRKRAATVSKDEKTSSPARSRPSTRGAPDDDENNTTALMSNDAQESATTDPPAKRTRGAASSTPSKRAAPPPAIDTSAGSASTPTPKKKKPTVSMPVDGAIAGSGEHGEAGTLRMDAPPPAGSVDPVGYHTNPPPTDRPVRVYADGVFDLFHLGHMRQLQQAKTAFPGKEVHLIVGVTGDRETHTRKGLTVMSGKERAESLRHCRWVDEVVEDCPWIISNAFLEKHGIDYVAHDDIPYGASEGDDIYKPIKEAGKFLVTQRTEGVSTTAIITKIVRDYEQYISRQLKRGTSRQELNVSWLKKNELELKRHVAELREQIRSNWLNTGQELSRELRSFWDRSRPGSPAPSRSGSLFQNGGGGGSSRSRRDGARSPLSPTTDSPANGGSGSSVRTGGTVRGRGGNMDFAAGYAMGVIGGVKGWMEGSRRRNLSDSRPQSPEESPENSPVEDEGRRKLSLGRERGEEAVDRLHS